MTQPWGKPPDDGAPRHRWVMWLVAAALVALIWSLIAWLPDALDRPEAQGALLTRIVILAVVVGGAIVHFRGRLSHAVLQALAWAGIFLVIVIGYSFRGEFGELRDRVLGELVPHRAIANADGSIAIRAASDGHFHAEVDVDGTKLRFMV